MNVKQKLLGIWHRIFPSKEKAEFSIGIYQGDNPLNLSSFEGNPVLTKEDVKDRCAAYVADPFMIKKDNLWYMFFEIKILNSFKTELAYATSEDGFKWEYQKVIPIEPLFRSYPHVFEFEDKQYLLSETAPLKSIIIYSAENFPEKWNQYAVIAEGREYVDPTILRHNGKWWIFASTTDNSELYLFYSDNLKGPWKEHCLSPIITKDKSKSRPAGRIIEYQGKLYRFAQDCSNYYGEKVNGIKILKLTEEEYQEEEIGVVLDKGEGWASKGMHTYNAHLEGDKWIAAVDGYKITTR